jgi:hypothetical protein
MAAFRIVRADLEKHDPSKPVAYLFGQLPLMLNEAYAVSNVEAGVDTPADHAVLRAWLVKMILVHGTWVGERCAFLQK